MHIYNAKSLDYELLNVIPKVVPRTFDGDRFHVYTGVIILCVVWLAVRRNVSVVQGMCAPLVPPASVWMRGLAGGFFGSRCPGRPIGRFIGSR